MVLALLKLISIILVYLFGYIGTTNLKMVLISTITGIYVLIVFQIPLISVIVSVISFLYIRMNIENSKTEAIVMYKHNEKLLTIYDGKAIRSVELSENDKINEGQILIID